jgi:hypothetical protein
MPVRVISAGVASRLSLSSTPWKTGVSEAWGYAAVWQRSHVFDP